MIYHGDPLGYIVETPDVMERILERKESILEGVVTLLGEREPSALHLIGTGSSWNAAYAARQHLVFQTE